MNFSLSEFCHQYGEFIKDICKSTDYKLSITQVSKLIHEFSKSDLVGKETMLKTLCLFGIDFDYKTPSDLYKNVFSKLTNYVSDHISFSTLHPFLFTLFLIQLIKKIKTRSKNIQKLCNPQNPQGLPQKLKSAGIK